MTGTFTPTFADEFNGTSLNTANWTPGWFGSGVSGPVNGSETHPYNSTNVSVPGDGSLHLALTSSYGSLVSSNGHFSFSGPGAMEASVYLPGNSTGTIYNWPAVWTDGQSWPANGEVDTMEGLGGSAAFHVHTNAGGPGGTVQGNFVGWHTFGYRWSGTTISFYYDGRLVGSEPYSTNNAPQYLILDNSTGTYGGPTVTPSTMLVDYVRVWKG